MKRKLSKPKATFKALDFFCSGGGMTSGFRKAGVKVIGGIDIDLECKETYTTNNPDTKFIHADIQNLSFATLEKELKVKRNDKKMIFIGCSPCQYWSKIQTDKTKSHETKNLLKDFQRFVEYFKPGYIVIENVPGILNRIDESPLQDFLHFLEAEKYHFKYSVINASHYGVPQTRRRFLLIASRVTDKITLPIPDTKTKLPTVRQFIGSKLQIPAYIGKDNSFQDIYGRMFWDKPGPTITTKFFSITNGRFAHPEQNRAISLREGATLQTFDADYKFISTSIASTARLIGNAVPPQLSMRIAASILNCNQ